MPIETGSAKATPQQNLERILNILPNGGQSLTVLSMPSDPDRWTYYTDIARAVNSKAGLPNVVRATNLQKSLVQTLEPISIAAKSDVDDRTWALTQSGIDMKPALIFVWQGFIEHDVNSPALLSSISARGAHADGVRTAGMTRFKVLQAIHELKEFSGEAVNPSEFEISEYTGFNTDFVVLHTDALEQGKFLDKKTKDRTEGPRATFTVTEKGVTPGIWQPFSSAGRVHPLISERAYQAIARLQVAGETITNKSLDQAYFELSGRRLGVDHASEVLSFWSRKEQGFLERHGFSVDRGSEVSLKPITEAILTKVLTPLEQWAYDPRSVETINQIRDQLIRDPDAFVDLYKDIAESYTKYSPFKNKNIEKKTADALEAITATEGISYTELARAMNFTASSAKRIVDGLIESGTVRREKSESGKVSLFLND